MRPLASTSPRPTTNLRTSAGQGQKRTLGPRLLPPPGPPLSVSAKLFLWLPAIAVSHSVTTISSGESSSLC
ncbi:hypothetical protein FIBSPDRAFT_1051181 [Athelia psychrophila]|uniref:Uncharacterized protein n=1 Tax=Athelia psychrophila TaxID=1759441 RepID=A0A165ZKH4_9AGAM|nr:hypothetical protein FIBSPDRAFT_1051181 [Fibularhizoctonia sp. CBS 109695]